MFTSGRTLRTPRKEKGRGRKRRESEGRSSRPITLFSPHKKIQPFTCYSIISSRSLVDLNQRGRWCHQRQILKRLLRRWIMGGLLGWMLLGRMSTGCDSLPDALRSYQTHRVRQQHRASVWSPKTEQWLTTLEPTGSPRQIIPLQELWSVAENNVSCLLLQPNNC